LGVDCERDVVRKKYSQQQRIQKRGVIGYDKDSIARFLIVIKTLDFDFIDEGQQLA
jgi:hypothetical protein